MEKYIKLALSLGAKNVIPVTTEDIVFDGRTLLKCMFGCGDWGKGCTCPSRGGMPWPWEMEALLRKYKTVLIIHSTEKKVAQEAAFAVEREAYLDGDSLSFSMADCALCEKCAGQDGEECRNKRQSRPSFHSVGVDVFSTVKKFGLPLEPLRDKDEPQNWYSAVWLNI